MNREEFFNSASFQGTEDREANTPSMDEESAAPGTAQAEGWWR
jgi:hypothetical protein